MWHLEQKKSSSEPGRESVYLCVPRSNVELHSLLFAKGLCMALRVLSGGSGVSHSPWAELARASCRNAARHAGSRHALDIIDPYHSSQMLRPQVSHCHGRSPS